MFSFWGSVWGMGKAKSCAFERSTNRTPSRKSFAMLHTALGKTDLSLQPVFSTDIYAAASAAKVSWLRLSRLGIIFRYGV